MTGKGMNLEGISQVAFTRLGHIRKCGRTQLSWTLTDSGEIENTGGKMNLRSWILLSSSEMY